MDLAHGFLAQQMTAHDQRSAELVAERRSAAAERRRVARVERATALRGLVSRGGRLARLEPGRPSSAH
ncbi:hypothetical protein [Agromyces sp. SYSU T00266]|uniref:hypothetical protein n=1 Tax=Agromyces zhanjiangensis TaxID=3158562 RepID=UPI003396DD04